MCGCVWVWVGGVRRSGYLIQLLSSTAIFSFLLSCGDILTPDLISRLMLPLDSALAMLSKYTHNKPH